MNSDRATAADGQASVPLNPDRDGWHWVRTPDEQDAPYQWRAAGECERGRWDASWIFAAGEWDPRQGTYLGPCLTPAEVAAEVTAAVQAEREACAARLEAAAAYGSIGMAGPRKSAAILALEAAAQELRARGSSDAKEAGHE